MTFTGETSVPSWVFIWHSDADAFSRSLQAMPAVTLSVVGRTGETWKARSSWIHDSVVANRLFYTVRLSACLLSSLRCAGDAVCFQMDFSNILFAVRGCIARDLRRRDATNGIDNDSPRPL
jgi:hypothetical protein